MTAVALFATCVVDQITPGVGVAAVELLERSGCTVAFPEAQTCCGQPAVTAGEPEAAATLARHWLDVFEPYDAIVAPGGSCAAMVRHWFPRLGTRRDRERAERLASRTYELAQYLVDVRARADLGIHLDTAVTVHDACHALRTLGVKDAVRALLTAAGATIVEMGEPETCCGFGGEFSIREPEVSVALGDRKLADAATTEADWLVSGDAACLEHLADRRRRTGSGPPPVHFAELLAAAAR